MPPVARGGKRATKTTPAKPAKAPPRAAAAATAAAAAAVAAAAAAAEAEDDGGDDDGDGDDDGPGADGEPKKRARYGNSLGLKTKRVVELLKNAPDGLLDLNKAAEDLGMAKRRMYDITAVLEGIGVIEKRGVSNIQWRGTDQREQSRAQQLQDELQDLIAQEQQVDLLTQAVQAHLESLMSTDNPDSEFLYVTQEDIQEAAEFAERTVFAIRAPVGSTVEVPDPSPRYPSAAAAAAAAGSPVARGASKGGIGGIKSEFESKASVDTPTSAAAAAAAAGSDDAAGAGGSDDDAGDEGGNYRIHVRSHSGPINVYLMSKPSNADLVATRGAGVLLPSITKTEPCPRTTRAGVDAGSAPAPSPPSTSFGGTTATAAAAAAAAAEAAAAAAAAMAHDDDDDSDVPASASSSASAAAGLGVGEWGAGVVVKGVSVVPRVPASAAATEAATSAAARAGATDRAAAAVEGIGAVLIKSEGIPPLEDD